ncbi:MAG: T9SS type A sorting domain-containing protein [Bacteroidota bacterium]
MRTVRSTLLLMVGINVVLLAQTAYTIPFASTGNTIELTVANSSTVAASQVKIEATNIPSWLRFTATEQVLQSLNANEEAAALFAFSVEKSAPVNQQHTLTFQITTNGQQWIKEISIVITAPERFELFQNYPNPFNPTTTISYQLPVVSRVSLKIFSLLGQEVTTLVDGEQLAGYHRETFDARMLASGIYVYQLTATAVDGTPTNVRRVMALVK